MDILLKTKVQGMSYILDTSVSHLPFIFLDLSIIFSVK